MKKSKKIFLRLVPVVMVLLVFTFNTAVFGSNPDGGGNSSTGSGIAIQYPSTNGATGSSTINSLSGNVWKTVSTVVQLAAIAAVVLAGVRYMFASADTKADIKGEMIKLVIGGVLVFLAVPVIQLVVKIVEEFI